MNSLMQEAIVVERVASAEVVRLNKEVEHLRMQLGYIVTQLMIRGDPRSLPEIVEEAAKATAQ